MLPPLAKADPAKADPAWAAAADPAWADADRTAVAGPA
jgi:hypothetical protein